jgi:hypothetical protein
MSLFTEKDGKKRLPVSVYVKILAFLGLIAFSAVVMRPVQYILSREMIKIRSGFIEKLEDITGFTVRYSSMRPSIFGSFDINNLSLSREDNPFFTVSHVKIHFSLFELLLRKKTFIHTVQIDRPVLNLDTDKDADTINSLSSLVNNKKKDGDNFNFQQIKEFLPLNANYQIRHLNLNLKNGQTENKIEDMNLNIKENNGEIVLFGRFYAEFKKSGIFDKIIILSADAAINGVCSANLESGSAELSFFYMTCSEQDEIKKTASFLKPLPNNSGSERRLFNLHPFKTIITLNDYLVSVRPDAENKKNNYYFNYNTESKGVSAGINLEDFKTQDIINFSDYLKNTSDMVFMQITGNSSFVSENGFLDYNVNIKGENNAESLRKDSFAVDIYGNDKEIIINDFYMTSAGLAKDIFTGTFGLSGNLQFSPLESNGTVYFDQFSLTGNENFNAVFNISSHEGDILVSSDKVEIARTMIDDFAVFIHPSEREMEIGASCFFTGGGGAYLDALFTGNPGEIEASLALDSLSLFEITEVFRPFSDFLNIPPVSRGLLKNSSIKTDVFFSTDFKNIVYNAPNIVFDYGNTNVLLSLSGTDRQITLTEGVISRGESELIFSSNVNFSNAMDLTFILNASYQDITWHIDGQILDRTTLIINDPNGFHGYGNISNNGALSGYIEGINYPILMNSQTIYLNFYSSLRYDSYDFWNLDLNNLTARYANAYDGAEFLKISGVADQDGASFREIFYTDNEGMLLGSADFSWDADFSYLDFILNITDGRENGEYYYAQGILKNENINIDASVSDMRLNRFINQGLPVIISADASIFWNSIQSFDAEINLSSLRTSVNEKIIHAAVNVNVSNDELSVNNLTFDYSGFKANLSELKINIDEGVAAARADIRGILKEKDIEGNIEIDADFSGINSWFDLNSILTDFNGKLSVENFTYGIIENGEFKLVFSGKDGAVSAKGGQNDMIRFEMDGDGTFFAGLSSPFPIHGNVVGTLKNGIMDAKTDYFFIDITQIFNIFSAQEDFLITNGYITGKTDFRGPLWNPEFHGTARAASMHFKVPNFLTEDIKIAPFEAIAEGYEMTFGPVDILSGNGSGTASGWLNFENWAPVAVGLDISIQREKPVPYGINIFGFLAKGIASGSLDMVVNVNEKMIELKGDLFTNEAELGISMDDIRAGMENDVYSNIDFNSVVDLKVTAGSMVEFVWPAASPILRAMPEKGTVISITSDTQTGQYSLNSNIKIRSGELYYFDRSFFIRQGSMVLKENETQFDPRISARAEIRDRSDSGPVTISMIIENQPLFSFEPRFEATPGMTQLEIYSILGQNFNNIQGEENAEMAQRFLLTSTTDLVTQFIASSDVMAQFVFLRQFERQIRNFLWLDMFSVRTRFIQNAIVTAGASGLRQTTGQNPVERSNRVGNYFDNTTVFIGKYIGQDMFVQGMCTLKYDENSNIFGGLRFEPDIGIELQSPFINRWNFNIRWDWTPDSDHPENWWVNDNSITLIWSKSF